MNFEIWGQTDVGLKRENNQDSILVDQDLNLFIVADGMGGHRGGEVASAMAVETVQEIIEEKLQSGAKIYPKDLIKLAFKESSQRIYLKSTKDSPELMGMGTTMVLGFAHAEKLYIGNVGDSRAYLFKDDHLWQLTEDHSLVNEQIRAGIIDENNPETMVGRNVITRSVGFEQEVVVDIVERDVIPGEVYILCSDGLTGLVSDDKITQICTQYPVPELAYRLVQEAKSSGGDDNVSVIVVRIK